MATNTGRPQDEARTGAAEEPSDADGRATAAGQPVAAPTAARSSRRVDVETLKGLAHPLRVRLWDALNFGGPATASQLAQRFGESSGSTSYHLRQLARHGFVTEVAGRGTTRERWWQVTPGGLTLTSEDVRDTSQAVDQAMRLVVTEWSRLRRSRAEDWNQRSVSGREDPVWVDAASNLASAIHLTAAELTALNAELYDVVLRWSTEAEGRRANPPVGTRPVEVQVSTFPLDVPEVGATDGTGDGA